MLRKVEAQESIHSPRTVCLLTAVVHHCAGVELLKYFSKVNSMSEREESSSEIQRCTPRVHRK